MSGLHIFLKSEGTNLRFPGQSKVPGTLDLPGRVAYIGGHLEYGGTLC